LISFASIGSPILEATSIASILELAFNFFSIY
jgi:hypothetical protein